MGRPTLCPIMVVIGTCGYGYYDPGEDWQDRYESKLQAVSEAFPAVELNRTFYSLPQVSTAERWRREAVADFEFVVKAWQAVTHPWRSPTWNGHRDEVADVTTDDLGLLQPTDAVLDAWEETMARVRALDARVVLVQTPPSFDHSEAHVENVRAFFERADRDEVDVAWEPRGDWIDHPAAVQELCAELDLVHVVDLMRTEPLDDDHVGYVRLHGLNDDPYDYDYEYTDDELDELAAKLRRFADRRSRVYCMFNNYEMYRDARRLIDRLDA